VINDKIGSGVLKQFIRYLYEYNRGERTRNVGFVKAEQGDTESTIHIHAKGLWMAGGESFRVYLLCEEDGRLFAVPQGEIAYMGPGLNYRLRYTDKDTGTPENYNDIEGILLESTSGRKFAAMWEEDFSGLGGVQLWPSDEAVTPGEAGEMPDEAVEQEEGEQMSDEAAGQENAGEMPREINEFTGISEESEKSAENMQMEVTPNIPTEENQPRRAEQGAASIMETQADIQTPHWKTTKIQRNEISILPRCEWRLANNNFLLHGYYNYHHLVFLDNGKRLKLGVPGIYHEREAKAAESFGFPEFIEASETGLSLGKDECSQEAQFGYWCRQVKRPPM